MNFEYASNMYLSKILPVGNAKNLSSNCDIIFLAVLSVVFNFCIVFVVLLFSIVCNNWKDSENEFKNFFCSPLVHPKTHELILKKSDLEIPSEVVDLVNRAIHLKNAGKLKKAMKIMEHCVSITPYDPNVLNNYGEFLEEIQNDPVKADQMYFQALTRNSKHEKAILNRQRIRTVVEEMDTSWLRSINHKRNKVAAIPDTNIALLRAKKETYFEHIYHTVGIEGNTMTLSEIRSFVETRMAVNGRNIAEHNEILGLDAALKYINSTLSNRIDQISVENILEVHRRVLGYVDPIESGMFRRTQVFVGGHVPPRPHYIPLLMDEFSEWLNSDVAAELCPIKRAALAHYKLVYIHPFIDGNGRTSRLLMNMILMQAGFPPIIIPKQERHRYYRVLELANEGDIRPFMRLIAECTEKTLDLFLWSTAEYSTASIPVVEFYRND